MPGWSHSVWIGCVAASVIPAVGRGTCPKAAGGQHSPRMQVPGREAEPGQHRLPDEFVGQGADNTHHAPVNAAIGQLWQV